MLLKEYSRVLLFFLQLNVYRLHVEHTCDYYRYFGTFSFPEKKTLILMRTGSVVELLEGMLIELKEHKCFFFLFVFFKMNLYN